MKEDQAVIQHIAPNLAAALGGPFSRVASQFIKDKFIKDELIDANNPDVELTQMMDNPVYLQKIKEIDTQFDEEMKKLDIDVFLYDSDQRRQVIESERQSQRPQIILSVLFLTAYFFMLSAIFYVEVSDSLNMKKGENSLMGEMQILFGVLTAGVGQILSFWFGASRKKQ